MFSTLVTTCDELILDCWAGLLLTEVVEKIQIYEATYTFMG